MEMKSGVMNRLFFVCLFFVLFELGALQIAWN